MTVWLIRHGRTEWNDTGRYQGQTDLPLSNEGAAELARAPFSPKTVYVTPLKRTQETARILFPDARQIVIDDLREMDFGVFEGRTYIEMENDAQYREWVEDKCRGRCPGGESREEFAARVCAAFEKLMDESEGDVVIVAHGGTQMSVMERFAVPHEPYFSRNAKNGTGYELDASNWRSDRALSLIRRVSYLNETD